MDENILNTLKNSENLKECEQCKIYKNLIKNQEQQIQQLVEANQMLSNCKENTKSQLKYTQESNNSFFSTNSTSSNTQKVQQLKSENSIRIDNDDFESHSLCFLSNKNKILELNLHELQENFNLIKQELDIYKIKEHKDLAERKMNALNKYKEEYLKANPSNHLAQHDSVHILTHNDDTGYDEVDCQ